MVQRATAAILNAIYEEDFLGFSYGFRPGRGAHDALDALCVGITSRKVNFILDADIQSFFDTVSQEWLIRFAEHRIGDKRIIRQVQKWLKAGVLEDGVVMGSDRGTGQGAVISPLLANIYLHYLLERLRGFALSLHPEKTRLIEFGRFATKQRARRQLGKPETFQFLGFTFICGQSRRGRFLLKRKSRGDRMRAKLMEVREEMRWRRHQPFREQGKWLGQVVRGFFAYHAVPTNTRALNAFRHRVMDLWRRSLKRRSQRDRTTWERIAKLADDFLPKPRILHPWPHVRFAVNHPRWEPSA